MNEIGYRNNHLTIISDSYLVNGRRMVMVKCDCGKEREIRLDNVKSGNNKTCGCHIESQPQNHNYKDGRCGTRIYSIYRHMKNRTSPRYHERKYYFDRGIHICDEWLGQDGFEKFKEWSLANGYNDSLTIDRINNDKGYCPENCRWVSMAVQNRNKRSNINISFNGKTQCISDWSKEIGISVSTIQARLYLGWDAVEAITTPLNAKRKQNRIKFT